MKGKWTVLLAAVLVGIACIPFSVNGCSRDTAVSRGGVNQEMNNNVETEVATFALG